MGKGKSITGLKLEITRENGQGEAIFARAKGVLRESGRGDMVERFAKECEGGDYLHLLDTCARWFDCY